MTTPKAAPMRTLIVTAGDEGFMPLLRGLVESLQQWEPRPFTDLACLDVGLGPESREWVSRYAAHVVSPGWDLPVDPALREAKPHVRALTARPFLPKYFPGYDIYLWIDADAWVQSPFALEWCLAAAAKGALAAAPEVDRAYRHSKNVVEWRRSRMQRYFGDEAAGKLGLELYLNSGVFALRADAPHWEPWARHFSDGLKATNGTLLTDQTALNHMLWTEKLPVHPLPALCNWLCHLAVPGFDARRQKFYEPFAPSQPIGILHLAGKSRHYTLEFKGGDSPARSMSLRYPGKASQDQA